MRMGYGLNMEQTQKLIMTPELRQAITVLQLSSLELSMYIEQQLQENPMLELTDDDYGREEEFEPTVEPEPDGGGPEYDLDWEEYLQESSDDPGIFRQERWQDQQEYSYENFLYQMPTLTEHLTTQLNLSPCRGKDKLIGEYLIGNIDENGYLRVPLKEVAACLNVSTSRVFKVLKVIQGFDPPGVGARSLEECLLIQVGQLGIKNEILNKLIKEHLSDLAKGKLNRIAQSLGVTVQEVQKAADVLRTLDPKPGRNFSNLNDTRYIVPDIVLEKVEGEYVILINDVAIPRLTINSTYRSVLSSNTNCDSGTRRFVESKLNAAAWLIRSIEQRRLTLYKVAKCLVDLQRDFLDYGVKYLKPLNLKKVAEMVGLHESTVSRATSNKYIQTPQGVFEMKYFFCTGLNNTAGNMVSAECIKKMLQEIVAGEDARSPLNDQKISELFRQRGIKISRRTVAKYRDELGIAAIRKRKRY
ncbi:MAG: RNA polymerase factor sigma-54 [Pelotomaculum sp.]|uniref:DNA-directed RNA polymerase specialized sigma subunit, sigma54 homolog n=1 Tax=Pelotomaculum thermopropionicum (strain DSM 13744 / JCM 10971 / SI) TaxID=370438 RepID=A5CYP0_PELTS|nr:RNA polymerase factor sigma-54 [Pelotomaculum sp.]BAF60905.1 DNA-directed RNA polymerase specialized sigma subunit, sigma54 homolog [Pelotomaculum thermopropionicum SI]